MKVTTTFFCSRTKRGARTQKGLICPRYSIVKRDTSDKWQFLPQAGIGKNIKWEVFVIDSLQNGLNGWLFFSSIMQGSLLSILHLCDAYQFRKAWTRWWRVHLVLIGWYCCHLVSQDLEFIILFWEGQGQSGCKQSHWAVSTLSTYTWVLKPGRGYRSKADLRGTMRTARENLREEIRNFLDTSTLEPECWALRFESSTFRRQ